DCAAAAGASVSLHARARAGPKRPAERQFGPAARGRPRRSTARAAKSLSPQVALGGGAATLPAQSTMQVNATMGRRSKVRPSARRCEQACDRLEQALGRDRLDQVLVELRRQGTQAIGFAPI